MAASTEDGWNRHASRAGALLAITALLVVFTMGHHPHGHGGGQEGLSLANIVHAAMIVFLSIEVWALAVFSLAGGHSALRLAGLVAYAISVIGHVLAATINGFIVPSLAGAVDTTASHDLFILLWNANQAFATLGVHASGLAFILWGISLVKSQAGHARIAGLAGIAAGLVPSGLLMSGMISLDVGGAFIVYSAHSAWLVLLGVVMWQKRI